MFGRVSSLVAAFALAIGLFAATPSEARFRANGPQHAASHGQRAHVVHRARGGRHMHGVRRARGVRHVRWAGHHPRMYRHGGLRFQRWQGGYVQGWRHHRRHARWARPLFVSAPGFQPGCSQSQKSSYVGSGWLRVETVRVCYYR